MGLLLIQLRASLSPGRFLELNSGGFGVVFLMIQLGGA